MKYLLPALSLALLLSACGQVQQLVKPRPQLGAAAVQPQQVMPGGEITAALEITLPEKEGALRVTASSPDASLLTVSVAEGGRSLTIRAAPDALPQGLVPVAVSLSYADQTASVRVPVEIGGRIKLEFERFNALRAQANLGPVAFDTEASMNCWLHGRYSAFNNTGGHNEDPALPFASAEGLACASTSNVSRAFVQRDKLSTSTRASDVLFSVPFHAAGMLRPRQATVGIGSYARPDPANPTFVQTDDAITSRGPSSDGAGLMTFPGNGATTDMGRYPGAEWPNPLTNCPGYDPSSTGLPLVVSTNVYGDTTASEASLQVDGQALEVCSYGSTQYVNTVDNAGNYVGGPRGAQDIGRSILAGTGSVFLIPRLPLQAGKTYQASVKVNGQVVSWSFRTAASLRPQGLGRAGWPSLR